MLFEHYTARVRTCSSTSVYHHPIYADQSKNEQHVIGEEPQRSYRQQQLGRRPGSGRRHSPTVTFTACVESLTNTITVVVNVATTSLRSLNVAARTNKESTSSNPYDTEWINLSSKEGKHHWQMATQREKKWELLSLATENSEVLTDLF